MSSLPLAGCGPQHMSLATALRFTRGFAFLVCMPLTLGEQEPSWMTQICAPGSFPTSSQSPHGALRLIEERARSLACSALSPWENCLKFQAL